MRDPIRAVGSKTGRGFDYLEFAGGLMMPNYPDPAPLTAAEKSDLVTFVEVPELKPVTSAALAIKETQAAPQTIKVCVAKPYRVIHDGKPFVGGQTLTVPDDVEHSRWIESGWVTKVKGK